MSIFGNLKIERIIAHKVYQRPVGGDAPSPRYSRNLNLLSIDALEILQARLVQALNHKMCFALEPEKTDTGTAFNIAGQCFHANEATFIKHSEKLTELLHFAQTSASIPSGVVVIATGLIGNPRCKFVCLVKAEEDKGFSAEQADEEIKLNLLDVLFTDSQKLYKIAIFIENQASSAPTVDVYASDSQARSSQGVSFANFFIKSFLNCKLKETAKTQTKEFYEKGLEAIESLDLTPSEKIVMENHLTSYVSLGTLSSISPDNFAAEFLSDDYKDSFVELMPQGLKSEPITRDTTLIESKLKNTSIIFENKVKIIVPSENFAQSIEISESEDGVEIKVYSSIKKPKEKRK